MPTVNDPKPFVFNKACELQSTLCVLAFCRQETTIDRGFSQYHKSSNDDPEEQHKLEMPSEYSKTEYIPFIIVLHLMQFTKFSSLGVVQSILFD